MRFQTSYWNCPDKKSAFLYGSVAGGKKQALDFYIDPPLVRAVDGFYGYRPGLRLPFPVLGQNPGAGKAVRGHFTRGSGDEASFIGYLWNEQGQRKLFGPHLGMGTARSVSYRSIPRGPLPPDSLEPDGPDGRSLGKGTRGRARTLQFAYI